MSDATGPQRLVLCRCQAGVRGSSEEIYLNNRDELILFRNHYTGHQFGEGRRGPGCTLRVDLPVASDVSSYSRVQAHLRFPAVNAAQVASRTSEARSL
ncbi:hypothetical protein [Saccharothrix sp. NRRL B-16314]|uniref:hypothetical protein n=1 Tax=Saccharothrix sp. NRRL B-16314 TaxID=1463825 RepID=UPI00052796BC|nr:hypothetical protein [Saccharothrix sp. NRRL B-16314]